MCVYLKMKMEIENLLVWAFPLDKIETTEKSI